MFPSEWTQWLSLLASPETGAWIVIGAGIFFLCIAIKGLWTGSIWEPFTPPGFDAWPWGSDGPERHGRETEGFYFWLTLILVSFVGCSGIFIGLKVLAVW